MVDKRKIVYYRLGCVFGVGIFLLAVCTICFANSNGQTQNVDSNETLPYEKKQQPIIIWFHNGVTDKPEALKIALSSGLVNHVIVKYMHPADRDWRKKKNVLEAIEIVKRSRAKLIWCRNAWPYENVQDARLSDFFDANYYIRQITNLRAEAAEMGADYVALDMEAYAYAPVGRYLKGKDRIFLSKAQWRQLEEAIDTAIEKAGKVDFIFPGGSVDETKPNGVLARLGKMRIAEETYWSNEERQKRITFPYEIFGAYLNTVREDKNHPGSWHFLVPEIFEKSELWSKKEGLFLYPKERRAMEVARELLAYSRTLPVADPNTNK